MSSRRLWRCASAPAGSYAAIPLRAGDALQLSAALTWTEDAPRGETFVCLDARLRDAASRQGFAIRP